MGRRRNYTDDDFREAVRSSESIAQVMSKLGLRPTGGNYTHFRVIAARLKVDHSHFTGCAHLKGKKHDWTPKRPLCDILVQNSDYTRVHLKRRLLKEQLLAEYCAVCGVTEWQGKLLVLHLDHINGDPIDNRLENLRLLCPNCHSQTDTYGAKNRKL